jgi:hypothetical protein
MKEYKFNVKQIFLNDFFIPIRTKVHVIEVLMHTIKYMLLNPSVEEQESHGSIILRVDKMSRLFFFTEEKYFSIVFPFFVKFEDDKYQFRFQNLLEINSRLISQVLSIIKCDEFKATCSLDFISPICNYEEECDENFWLFLRELLLMEDGYIRYDYDLANENGHMHPLNHYDLFYSSNATFKLGLKEKDSHINFVDILDINTNCKYVIKSNN